MANSALPFPTNSHVVAYLRDSGGEDQELSVAQQEDFIRRWCVENNLLLTQVYADAAQPGSSVVSRVRFLEMIRHFRSPDCNDAGIVIWKYSRFARAIDDSMFFKADLRRRGYVIHSINDNIPDSIDGRVFEALVDWMNDRQLLDLSSDVKRGLHHLVNQYGGLPGTPPRGFKREQFTIGDRRDGSAHTASKWVPDPELWEKCQLAWQMRAEGSTYREINEVTHLFGSLNSYPTFFANRLYLGELNYGDLTIPDYSEPMVSITTWDAVQARTTANKNPMRGPENKHHPRRVRSSFLLSGLVYCARCGSPMNGSTVQFKENEKPYSYYTCSRANRRHDCDALKIPRETLETAVFGVIRDFVLDPDQTAQRQRDLNAEKKSGGKDLADQRKLLQKGLNSIRKQISNIIDIMAAEGKKARALTAKLLELEQEEAAQQTKIDNLRSVLPTKTTTPDQARRLVLKLQAVLKQEDPETLRALLFGVIHRITTEREGKFVRGIVQFYNPPDILANPTDLGDLDNGPSGSSGPPPRRNLSLSASPLWRHTPVGIKIYSVDFSCPTKRPRK